MRCVGFLACVLLLLGTVIDVHAVVAPVCWPGSAAYDRHFYTNGYAISNVQNGETYVYASYGTSSTGHAPLYRMRPDGTQRRAVLCSDAFEPSTNCTFRSSFVRAPSYFHIDEDNKYLYFFETTSKAIGRIPLSLTGKVAWILCSTSFTGPCTKKLPKFADFGIKGYVVDSKVTHRIYFMDGADYIGSSPLPGQTGDTRRLLCSALFCDFQFNVTALASLELDLVSDPKRMYFAHGPGRISSAFLDGSNVKKLICNNSDCVTSHSYVNPLLISLDLVSPQKRLYWADVATGRVVRSRLDGTGTGTILCTVTGCPEVDAPDVAINFLHVVGSTTGPARVYVLDAYGREITGNDASILSLNGDGTLLKTELCGARKGCSRRYARLDSPTRPELGKGGPNVVLTFFTDYGLVYFDVTSGQLHEPALRNLEVSALSVASPSSGLYWSLNGRLVYEGSNGCNLAFGPTFTGRASTILCPDGCANRARHLIAQPEDVRIVGDPNTLYWVDKEVGAIITANFDGRNAKQVVCAANCQNKVHIQHKPYYLHVDSRGLGSSIGSKLYWISKDIKTVVWSANLDGTNIKKLQCTDLTCNIVSPPLGTDLTGFALDLHKPLPVLYIGDATNLAVLKINGDGSGYGGLICSSSCSDPSRNLGLKYIRRPEGLQLDLDSNIFPHDDSRLFFVDTLNNHAIAVDLDGSLDPVILTCEVDTGISCRKRIIGLALTGETLIVDDKGKRYFYYVGTVNSTHDVVIRHQIRATHDDDIKAAEVVLCSTGYPYGDCLHRIDGLNRPKNLVVRRDPGTGERELWFTQNNIPGETESVSSRQSLWRAQLDGGFAHIEVANGKLIPADCVPATTAFTNAECRELCPSRTNQGNCTRDKCTCNAA